MKPSKTNRTSRPNPRLHARAEQMAAGHRDIVIETVDGAYGGKQVVLKIWWAAGRKVQSAALLADIYGMIAHAFEVAAARGTREMMQPEIDAINLAGGDACSARLTFTPPLGTDAQAREIDEILHDAIPAPGSEE